MEYEVAYGYSAEGCGNCLDNFEEKVNNLISARFKPFGSLQFEHGEKAGHIGLFKQ